MSAQKILVSNMDQVEELLIRYGSIKTFLENCELSAPLRREMEEEERRRREAIPEIYNYDMLRPGPHAKAMAFHNSKAYIKVAIGGNRSGKSYTLLMEVAHHLLGEYPEWWTGFKYYVGLDGQEPLRIRLCGSTYDRGIADVIVPTLTRILPAGYIPDNAWIKDQNRIIGCHTTRGDYIQFMTYKQECETFESDTFDIVGHDEPPPLAIFQANCARVIDRNGYVMVGATVLRRHAWLHDELDRIRTRQSVFKETFKTEDNPTMTKEKLAKFESMLLTPEEKDARMLGVPMHHSGRAFKEFNYTLHTDAYFDGSDEQFSMTMYIDPHIRKSWMMMWVDTNAEGVNFVSDEAFEGLHTYKSVALQIALVEKKITPDEMKTAMAWDDETVKKFLRERFYGNGGRFCCARIMDTSGWENDPATGLPKADTLREYGIYCIPAQKRGSESMITKLRGWLTAVPYPKLKVKRNCKEVIYELTNCVWKDYINEHLKFSKDAPAIIEPKRSDFIDLLRYCAKYDPKFTPRKKQNFEEIEYESRIVNEFAGV